MALKTKPIPGFENYKISRSGIVIGPKNNRLSHCWRGWPGLYLYVTLHKNGNNKRIKKQSHVLVALAWVPNPDPENFKFVNHKSGNRSNISSYNLEWCDHKYNCRHRNGNKNKRRY